VLNGNFYPTAEMTSAAGVWRTRQNAKLFVSASSHNLQVHRPLSTYAPLGYIQLKLPRVIHYTREPRSSLSTAEAPCGRLTRSIRKSSKCLPKYWRCRQCNSHRRRDFARKCTISGRRILGMMLEHCVWLRGAVSVRHDVSSGGRAGS
jgi:hypothetical protein